MQCGFTYTRRRFPPCQRTPICRGKDPDSLKGGKRTSSQRSSRSERGTASGQGSQASRQPFVHRDPTVPGATSLPAPSRDPGRNRWDGGRVPPLPRGLALHCPHLHPPGSPALALPAPPREWRPAIAPRWRARAQRRRRLVGAAAAQVNKQLSLEDSADTLRGSYRARAAKTSRRIPGAPGLPASDYNHLAGSGSGGSAAI